MTSDGRLRRSGEDDRNDDDNDDVNVRRCCCCMSLCGGASCVESFAKIFFTGVECYNCCCKVCTVDVVVVVVTVNKHQP